MSNVGFGLQGHVTLFEESRETGLITRVAGTQSVPIDPGLITGPKVFEWYKSVKSWLAGKNTITSGGLAALIDVIDGSKDEHLDTAGSQLEVIVGNTGANVKTLTGQVAGFPTDPTDSNNPRKQFDTKHGDISVDTYGWEDTPSETRYLGVRLKLSDGTTIAEYNDTNNVWENKTNQYNWYWQWTISMAPTGTDASRWNDEGIDNMLACIAETGGSSGLGSKHWNQSNMKAIVFDANDAFVKHPGATGITNTDTTLQWVFADTSGGGTWTRVEVNNHAQNEHSGSGDGGNSFDLDKTLYDDNGAGLGRTQISGDTFTYTFTITFAAT